MAARAGHDVEIIAVLDRADELTATVVADLLPGDAKIIDTDFGDLGEARNAAAEAARGRYVGFLDADDLWCPDWLEASAAAAEAREDPVVWHPEVSVFFGGAKHILHHVDMEGPEFKPATLVLHNYWTALSFAARQLYLDHPYPRTDLDAGFGFEDWAWNLLTASHGVLHKIVPGTGHVIRRKLSDSLGQSTVRAQAVPRPNDYMIDYIRRRLADGDADG